MRNLTITLGVAALLLVLVTGWQVGACELANVEFQDDMQDIASQVGTRIGLAQMTKDEELRDAVIRKAKEYGIELDPNQVTVQHSGSGVSATVSLSAEYSALIKLPGLTFRLHLTPSTGSKTLIWRTFGMNVPTTPAPTNPSN